MEKILDSLLESPHPQEVKNKFILIFLKGQNNLNRPEADWEQLCEYAYGLITKVPLNWSSYLAEDIAKFNLSIF
jgi:hypothetical protein